MSAEALFLVVLVVCAAYWYWHREKSDERSLSPPQTPEPSSPSPIRASEEADPFLQEVASEKKRIDTVISMAQQQHECELDMRFADDVKLKKRLSKFARDNKLDEALIALWGEVKYYPAWSTRDDFDKWNRLHLESISSSDKGDTNSIEFTHQAQRFKITERRWSGMEGDSYSDLSFFEDSEEVFAIGCSVDHGEYETSYRCNSVSAFKKRGNWAKVLLEYYGRIQIERNKSSAEFKYFRADEIKSRFEE